jgi:hypothetical protein
MSVQIAIRILESFGVKKIKINDTNNGTKKKVDIIITKKLPTKLKRKLIQINNTARKVCELTEEFDDMLKNEYGLNSDLFYENTNDKEGDIAPLINICNSGDIYDDEQLKKDIEEIERIFLLNINNQTK